MKKKGKIILTVDLVLAIAAVAAAVAAFRPQPVLDPSGTYEVQRVNYWLEGPNLEWEGYLHTMPTPEQAQEILALLEGYEKTLSADRLPQRLFLNLLPAQFQSMEVQLPEWLEAAIFIWNPEDEDDYFNLILGDGHVQIRDGYTYLPPYYEISNGQQLYQELDAILHLDPRMAELRD